MVKFGDRRHGAAEASICSPSALPAFMRGPIVELRRLYTRKGRRNQGEATSLMLSLTVEADIAGTVMLLHVDPREATDRDRLVGFYERFGFAVIQPSPLLMVRPHIGMVFKPVS